MAGGGGFDGDADERHFGKVTIGSQANPVHRPVWAGSLELAHD